MLQVVLWPDVPFYNVAALIYNSLTLACEPGQHMLTLDRAPALRRPLVKHFSEMVKTRSFLWASTTHLHGSLQSVVTGWVTSKSFINLFKMQIFRPPESEILGVETSDLCFKSPWGESDVYWGLRTTVLAYWWCKRPAIMKHTYFKGASFKCICLHTPFSGNSYWLPWNWWLMKIHIRNHYTRL